MVGRLKRWRSCRVVRRSTPATTVSRKRPTAEIQTFRSSLRISVAPVLTASSTRLSTSAPSNRVAGSYNVTANGTGATSTSFSLTNNKAATTTAVTSSQNPSDLNQNVIFTATVTSVATPTGTVQFKDNGANLGSPAALNANGV